MKNWGWVVLAVLVVSIIWWGKFGFRLGSPAMTCLYSDTEKKIETICVNQLKENDLISSPLKITGRARGNWFFEASFPIQLLDQNSKRLAEVVATAQGDWMTTDLVPFTAELTFTTPAGDTGQLVLNRDNPSGLPENDAQLIIPVRFR
ncbi:MAG: Gmad2 immunoglobulin-like domain-containing protein [Patescibacteria group bacterium]|jgi:hypothetical protein